MVKSRMMRADGACVTLMGRLSLEYVVGIGSQLKMQQSRSEPDLKIRFCSMSGIISGRARVVFSSSEFLHLSKGGLDGKIVAYRDSWLTSSFEMQDWVTFKAKACEPEGTHVSYGVRYRALPKSVKFEAKGKIVDGIGTLLKVDEAQGQYGFIKANDGSTVYFTASVVRPETKDIRSVFKTGVQIRYRATEQKQNTVQWRAIAVCGKNASIDSLTGRQPKSNVSNNPNRTVVGLALKKPVKAAADSRMSVSPSVDGVTAVKTANNDSNNNKNTSVSPRSLQSPSLTSSDSALSNGRSAPLSSTSPKANDLRPSPVFNMDSLDSSMPQAPSPFSSAPFSSSSHPSLSFPVLLPTSRFDMQNPDFPSTGNSYEDAVIRLTYFANSLTDNVCELGFFCEMPIEVTAVIDRESAVYLAGEAIHCKVIVKNNGKNEEEPLAWGSVHVQCERIINTGAHDELAKKTSHGEKQRKQSTSMARSAFTVFSCRPVVLFCELKLGPGERREFECVQQLPSDGIPPSFKGFLVRYVYKLTLGVQHLKSPIKLINIPLRVIQSDLGLLQPLTSSNSNPFIANEKVGPSVIDLMTEAADCLTAPQGSYSYCMTNHKGKIANFVLYKKAFKLGEDVIGRFVFTGCQVPCIQFTVSVQTVESLSDDINSRKYTCTYMTEHVVCAYWKDALVKLNIPLSATPTFHTETVQLKWRLHFELVTSDCLVECVDDGLTEAPENLDIETMTWDLDIKVFPCSPYNAALTSSGISSTASLIV
ncbi:unnamed protein product [Enterobius vermicularis]|uniref:Arrestin_C domain-containing protein n=1 Tax=Enterobius vermicularis TaxID=51028 RepID=A0A158QA20_ENTVE|nr:unnamed protein product [Enterobius vermicularis]